MVIPLCATLETLVRNYEVILVDDGSSDATGGLAEELAAGNVGVQVIHHATHQGYGAMWRTGIAAATKQYIVLMDSDPTVFLCFPYVSALAELIRWGDAHDLVITYTTDPYHRTVASRCLAAAIQILFGMRRWDVARGFVLGPTVMLREMSLVSTGFLINVEVFYRGRQLGARTRAINVDKLMRIPEIPEHLERPMHRLGEAIALRWYLARSMGREITNGPS